MHTATIQQDTKACKARVWISFAVASVFAWLNRSGLGSRVQAVR